MSVDTTEMSEISEVLIPELSALVLDYMPVIDLVTMGYDLTPTFLRQRIKHTIEEMSVDPEDNHLSQDVIDSLAAQVLLHGVPPVIMPWYLLEYPEDVMTLIARRFHWFPYQIGGLMESLHLENPKHRVLFRYVAQLAIDSDWTKLDGSILMSASCQDQTEPDIARQVISRKAWLDNEDAIILLECNFDIGVEWLISTEDFDVLEMLCEPHNTDLLRKIILHPGLVPLKNKIAPTIFDQCCDTDITTLAAEHWFGSPRGIYNFLLDEVTEQLCPHLSLLNMPFATLGTTPDDWEKLAQLSRNLEDGDEISETIHEIVSRL